MTKKQNVNHRKNREYYGFCKSKEESRKNNPLRSREGEAGDHFLTKDPNEATPRLCPAGSTWGVLELGTNNLGLVDNFPPHRPLPLFLQEGRFLVWSSISSSHMYLCSAWAITHTHTAGSYVFQGFLPSSGNIPETFQPCTGPGRQNPQKLKSQLAMIVLLLIIIMN